MQFEYITVIHQAAPQVLYCVVLCCVVLCCVVLCCVVLCCVVCIEWGECL